MSANELQIESGDPFEVVYSAETTDKEVERIAAALHGLQRQSSHSNSSSTDPCVEVAVIRTSLGWHRNIGSTAIVATATVLVFLFAWLFIEGPKQAKEDAKTNRENMSSLMTEKLAPVSERLAVLSATVELLKPEAGKRLGSLMQNNLRGDLNLGLKTVGSGKTGQRKWHKPTRRHPCRLWRELLLTNSRKPMTRI